MSNSGCLKKMVGTETCEKMCAPGSSFHLQYLGCEKDSCHFKEVGALNPGKYPKVWYFGMTQRGLAASEMGREDLLGKPEPCGLWGLGLFENLEPQIPIWGLIIVFSGVSMAQRWSWSLSLSLGSQVSRKI